MTRATRHVLGAYGPRYIDLTRQHDSRRCPPHQNKSRGCGSRWCVGFWCAVATWQELALDSTAVPAEFIAMLSHKARADGGQDGPMQVCQSEVLPARSQRVGRVAAEAADLSNI